MLDPFDPLTDLDQLRSRYDVLRLLRHDHSPAALYAVRARSGERHFLVGMWPAGNAGGGRAGALRPWQAHTMSPLDHPKLMTIHAVHHLQGGALAVAIERRRGRTLADRIQSPDPMTAEEAGRIFRDIAEALLYLHERGAVHCEVRAEAVFLDRDAGVARLAPFAVEPGTRPPEAAQAHRAPEMIGRGGAYDDREASPRSDLYALGVLGCQMLRGPRPGDHASGSDAGASRQRLVAELPADVPPGLRAAIEGCLARRPRRRWHDAAELLACLEGEAPRMPAVRRWAGVAHLEGRVRSFAGALSGRSMPGRSTRRRVLGVTLIAGAASIAVASFLGLREQSAASASGAERTGAEFRMAPVNALLETAGRAPGVSAGAALTGTAAGELADLGAIQFLQIERDPLDGSAASARESVAPGRSRPSATRAAAPARVVLLGEPIEP